MTGIFFRGPAAPRFVAEFTLVMPPAPLRVTAVAAAAAVTTPAPQVVLALAGVATTSPAGRVRKCCMNLSGMSAKDSL